MNVNLKAQLQNKTFWVSLTVLLMVLANQIASLFGLDITIHTQQSTEIAETILMILGLIGIINEPKEKDDEL